MNPPACGRGLRGVDPPKTPQAYQRFLKRSSVLWGVASKLPEARQAPLLVGKDQRRRRGLVQARVLRRDRLRIAAGQVVGLRQLLGPVRVAELLPLLVQVLVESTPLAGRQGGPALGGRLRLAFRLLLVARFRLDCRSEFGACLALFRRPLGRRRPLGVRALEPPSPFATSSELRAIGPGRGLALRMLRLCRRAGASLAGVDASWPSSPPQDARTPVPARPESPPDVCPSRARCLPGPVCHTAAGRARLIATGPTKNERRPEAALVMRQTELVLDPVVSS